MNPDKQLEKLKTIIDVLDTDRASVDETAEAFQAVLEIIKNLKDTIDRDMASNKGEMDDLYSGVLEEIKKTETRMSKMSDRLEGKIDEDKIILQQQIIKEVNSIRDLIPTIPSFQPLLDRITEVEKKIPQIPEEITAEEVRDKLESINKESEKLDIEAIKDLKKELDELRKKIKDAKGITIFGGGGSSGGGRIVKSYDLSGLLDGTTRTFTTPVMWRLISVHLSSSPNILRETTDYTWTPQSITFTSEVSLNSISSGQTCILVYGE